MVLTKRTIYTIITPLPPQITRETVLTAFRDHGLMIELNPMVIHHSPCRPPRFALPDEFHSPWYEIHDKVHYTPGGVVSGKVVYHACLHDLPNGLQTHCYAALGTNIRGKWLLCGTLPGEPRPVPELGLKVPLEGLYVREDIDMRTNFMMTKFVKKNLENAHAELLKRLIVGVGIVDSLPPPISPLDSANPMARPDTIGFITATPNPPIASPMLSRQSMREISNKRARASLLASPSSSVAASIAGSVAGSSPPSIHLKPVPMDRHADVAMMELPVEEEDEDDEEELEDEEDDDEDWTSRLVHPDSKPLSSAGMSGTTLEDKYSIDRISEESEQIGEAY